MTDIFLEFYGNLSHFGFVDFFTNLLDFLIVWAIIYSVLHFLRGTKSILIIGGLIGVFILVALAASVLHLTVLKYLLERFWDVFGLAIVVIFLPELRRFFSQAGALFTRNVSTKQSVIDEVVKATIHMSKSRTGALIVFERDIGLAGTINTSVKLDAEVNDLLLQSIFFKNSPLHDCAVIIKNNKIVAAHAVLPLMQEDVYNPVRRLGTRHRAAVGITEETDAVALVVSEETGTISIANKGRIMRGISDVELATELNQLLIRDDRTFQKLYSQATAMFFHKQENQPVQADLFSSSNDSEKDHD